MKRTLAYVGVAVVALVLVLFVTGLSVARVSYYKSGGLPPFGESRPKPERLDRSFVIGFHPIWRDRNEATHSCSVRDAQDTVARVSGLWGGRPADGLEIDSWCEEPVRLAMWGVEIGR
ncbi:MAG TPA: hypothetical protein VE596_08160 [Gaiellaceae bacterium]|jgi:hypothetical protein|nr:hypothetical protein [Gaiellaceae bacterium]